MINLPPTFWQDVEKELKYVLYGDSISEDAVIKFKLRKKTGQLSFSQLWAILKNEKKCLYLKTARGNEFLHFNDSFNFFIETYDPTKKEIIYAKPYYIVRHKFKGEMIDIRSKNAKIKVTKNHSLIDILEDGSIEKLDPNTAKHIFHYLSKVKITAKKLINYDNYVYDFEVPTTSNFIANEIVCHNTDSLYIKIPKTFDTVKESIDECENAAGEINKLISHYYNSFLLPKMGVDPKYNETFFKTELTANSMMLLSTKKTYAYNLTSKEHKIFDPPVTKYTGIPVVKSDTVPFLKDFIKTLTEDIALTKGVNISNELSKLATNSFNTILEKIKTYDFEYIAAPGKWSNKEYNSEIPPIIGMRLYNTLIDQDIFKPGSFGIYIPIKIRPTQEFNELNKSKSKYYLCNTPETKINYLTMPYGYDKDKLKQMFDKFGIITEPLDFWEWSRMVDNEVAKKIIEVIKSHA